MKKNTKKRCSQPVGCNQSGVLLIIWPTESAFWQVPYIMQLSTITGHTNCSYHHPLLGFQDVTFTRYRSCFSDIIFSLCPWSFWMYFLSLHPFSSLISVGLLCWGHHTETSCSQQHWLRPVAVTWHLFIAPFCWLLSLAVKEGEVGVRQPVILEWWSEVKNTSEQMIHIILPVALVSCFLWSVAVWGLRIMLYYVTPLWFVYVFVCVCFSSRPLFLWKTETNTRLNMCFVWNLLSGQREADASARCGLSGRRWDHWTAHPLR